MECPDVYDYTSYRAFLRDWFAWKKHDNPRYSHRAFVRRTGQASPSLLVDVIEARRNLTERTVLGFVRALSLGASEASFFRHLVDFDQAGTQATKAEAWERITATKRFREARRIEGASYECLAHWYYAAIRELACCPGFRADPRWIAHKLQPRITPKQAERALDALFTTGLLTRDVDGEILTGEPAFSTPVEVRGLAVNNYHVGMLQLAAASIEAVDPRQRHFTAMTAAVPASLLPKLKAEINQMCARLAQVCSELDEDPDQVVQIHLHVFPLTEVPDPEDVP
jgi:uncharacterized protein (TIGR02147 family)